MGVCASKDEAEDAAWPTDVRRDPALKWSYAAATLPPARPREKVKDPAHYQAKHLKNTDFVRGPGTINGDQVQIDSCEGCRIYLVDVLDSVVMDDCRDCDVFIGPTAGSVFLRTSSGCRVVALCGQLRLRDCSDIDLSLYCGSKPVIESSKRITFGCFDGFYFNLREQLAAASLSAFNNRWSDVHDFTPKQQHPNFIFAPEGRRLGDVIPPLSRVLPDLIPADEERNPQGEVVVPRTWGLRPLPPDGEFGVAVFLPHRTDRAVAFLTELAPLHPGLRVTQTKEWVPTPVDARAAFARSALPKATKRALLAGPCVAVGLFGPGAVAVSQRLLAAGQGPEGALAATSPAEASHLHHHLFVAHQLGGDSTS